MSDGSNGAAAPTNITQSTPEGAGASQKGAATQAKGNTPPADKAPQNVTEKIETKPAAEQVAELFELPDGDRKLKLTKEQLIARAQKGLGADRAFRELAEEKKRDAEWKKRLATDPEAALAEQGIDFEKLQAEIVARKAKFDTMTPEQRKAFELQQERDDLKRRVDATESEKAKRAQDELDARTMQTYQQGIVVSAEKHGIDPTPENLDLMCGIGLEYLEMGVKLTPDQLAQETLFRSREFIEQRDRKILSKLTDDRLEEYLGPEVVKRILKNSLKKNPAKTERPVARTSDGKFEKKQAPVPRMTQAEFNKKYGIS